MSESPSLPGTPPPELQDTVPRGKALLVGAMQIVFAVAIPVLDWLFPSHADRLAVSSGAFVWGPLTFIIAGCLTAAAGASLDQSVVRTEAPLGWTPAAQVKAAVRFNSVAAVAAVAATIIFFVDFVNRNQTKSPGIYKSFPLLSSLELGLCVQVVLIRCRGFCEQQLL